MITERDDLLSLISDLSKDLNGWRYRPSEDASIEDLREMARDYSLQLEAEIQREAREEAEDSAERADILGGAFRGPAPRSPFESLL